MSDTPDPQPPAWDDNLLADPHAIADKPRRVRQMFAAIAESYDLNNRLHSLGRDQAWRRTAVGLVNVKTTDVVLDVACGTGDLVMEFSRRQARRIYGVDFTYEMLLIAVRKIHGRAPDNSILLIGGDAMNLPVADRSVDVVSIAFGIRNVADPARAIREFYRVLRPGGRVVILEFSLPHNPILRWCYNLYFRRVMPRTATWISGDRTGAYRYLPQSVNTFIDRPQMTRLMTDAGFNAVSLRPLTFGIAVAYVGHK